MATLLYTPLTKRGGSEGGGGITAAVGSLIFDGGGREGGFMNSDPSALSVATPSLPTTPTFVDCPPLVLRAGFSPSPW